jgi:hypothetical protein
MELINFAAEIRNKDKKMKTLSLLNNLLGIRLRERGRK